MGRNLDTSVGNVVKNGKPIRRNVRNYRGEERCSKWNKKGVAKKDDRFQAMKQSVELHRWTISYD